MNNRTYRNHSVRRDQCFQKGAAMVGLIGGIVAVGVVGASLVSLTRSSERSHLTANSGARAHFLAESGLEFAQRANSTEEWRHGRKRLISLQGGDTVEVIRHEDTFWATAMVDAGTVKEGRAFMPARVRLNPDFEDPSGPVDPSDPLSPDGGSFVIFGDQDFLLSNNLCVEGNIGMVDKGIEVKGLINGDILGDHVEVNPYRVHTSDVIAASSVDVKVGYIIGDVHSGGTITLRSQNSAVEGWLFAQGTISLNSGAEVKGHVHSYSGDVNLSGHAQIGTPENPVEVRAQGNVTLSNSAVIYGDVHAGGSISGADGIVGNAFAGGSVSGDADGDEVSNASTFIEAPIAPDLRRLASMSLPEPTVFGVGNGSFRLRSGWGYRFAPGTYGRVYTSGNASGGCIYLKTDEAGHGNYYFKSLEIGQNMNLFLDLSGEHDIRVFSQGNIEFASGLKVWVKTTGTDYQLITSPSVDPKLARRVYWESHCDFVIKQNHWFGTVYTPYGLLRADSPCYLTGTFYSGGGHFMKGGKAVFQPSNYLSER